MLDKLFGFAFLVMVVLLVSYFLMGWTPAEVWTMVTAMTGIG